MSGDYGLSSLPITDLFVQPTSPEEWQQYALSESQLLHFKEYGYLKDVKILTDQQVDRLRQELALLTNPDNPGNEYFYEYHSNESENSDTVLFHALGAWRASKAFHDILWAPAFRLAAYQLLGNNFHFFHDQLFAKPAKHGGVVAWHQDYSYWTWTTPMQHLTAWIGLDDATTENGCLHYVPKSHKWGLVEKTGLAGDMLSVRSVLSEEQIKDFDLQVPIEMKMGHASFHHPLMMHGSYENKSDNSRRATVINVFAEGVVSNKNHANAPGTDNYPQVPFGQKMQGQYYPLLFDNKIESADFAQIPTILSV